MSDNTFTLAETVAHRSSPSMRPGATTDDYRYAIGGGKNGDEADSFGTLAYEWSDRPHRLVYDLCGEIDSLRSQRDALLAALTTIIAAHDQFDKLAESGDAVAKAVALGTVLAAINMVGRAALTAASETGVGT
jgi:hypothetical protein